jgi:hypothetical protein
MVRFPLLLVAGLLLGVAYAVAPVDAGCIGSGDIFCDGQGSSPDGIDTYTCGKNYSCRTSPGSFNCTCQLAGGIIAAIVISCVAFVALVVTILVCLCMRRQRRARLAAQAKHEEDVKKLLAERVARGEPPNGWQQLYVGAPVLLYNGQLAQNQQQVPFLQQPQQQGGWMANQPALYGQPPAYGQQQQQPAYAQVQYGQQQYGQPAAQQQQPQQPLWNAPPSLASNPPASAGAEGYTPGQHLLSQGAPQVLPASAPPGGVAPASAPMVSQAVGVPLSCYSCGYLLAPFNPLTLFCSGCGKPRVDGAGGAPPPPAYSQPGAQSTSLY